MNIIEAQQRILDALEGLKIDTIDQMKEVRLEGMMLSFEGYLKTGLEPETFTFGLYVSKKILNKKTNTIYTDLIDIADRILEYDVSLDQEDSIVIRSIEPTSFKDGILEYRVGIYIN